MGCGSNSTLRHTALQEELARTQAELERSKAALAELARTPARAGADPSTSQRAALENAAGAELFSPAKLAQAAAAAAPRLVPERLRDPAVFRAELGAHGHSDSDSNSDGDGDSDSDIQEALGDKVEDLAVIVAGARYHWQDALAQAAALEALTDDLITGGLDDVQKNGQTTADNRGTLLELGAVEAPLAAMNAHVAERAVVAAACTMLGNLVCASPHATALCARAVELGAIESAMGALDAFPRDRALVRAALDTLKNLMIGDRAYTAQIIALGGMERTLEAMDNHPDGGLGVCYQAVFALNQMCGDGGDEGRQRLAALGVEARVRGAMAAPDVHKYTTEFGQRILDRLPKVDFTAQEAAARALAEEAGDCRAHAQLLLLRAQAARRAGRRWWGGARAEVQPAAPAATPAASQAPATASPGDAEHKFAAHKLILGASEAAAGGVEAACGLEDVVKAGGLRDPLAAIEREVLLHGSPDDCDNFYYIKLGVAGKWDDLPEQVKVDLERGFYHGGTISKEEYDAGHAGMTLEDFVNHPTSKLAGLKIHHVLVLRLYTSSSYRAFNGPLRQGVRPHPWKFCMFFLTEALKKLRVVDAKLYPEEFNAVKWLYRGMADMEVDAATIKSRGGTELAPMSTTDNKQVALDPRRPGGGGGGRRKKGKTSILFFLRNQNLALDLT